MTLLHSIIDIRLLQHCEIYCSFGQNFWTLIWQSLGFFNMTYPEKKLCGICGNAMDAGDQV
jgi:hypothetical protein